MNANRNEMTAGDDAQSNVVQFRHPLDGDFVRRAREALVIAVFYWGEERWSEPSIAAAMALAPELGAVPTPRRWTEIVDAIEAAVVSVLGEPKVAQQDGPRPAL
jgi:hypothetical protein